MDAGVYVSLLRAGRNCLRVSLFVLPLSILKDGGVTLVALLVGGATLVAGLAFLYVANKYSPYKGKRGRKHEYHKRRDEDSDQEE